MPFSIQPVLENNNVLLLPLQESDFESLYEAASDENIWVQHPNKDRWKKDVFLSFFEGAMKSKGAFKIIDKATNTIAGSSRFYDYNRDDNSIFIGYTFYAVAFWGTGLNPVVKKLMMDYIFQYVDKVRFHIGATNFRSQIAITRIGASKIAEEEVAYYNEPSRLNFVYEITKSGWLSSQNQ